MGQERRGEEVKEGRREGERTGEREGGWREGGRGGERVHVIYMPYRYMHVSENY